MEKNRSELKSRFKKGDKPTEQDYADLIDSFVHRLEDDFVDKLPDATTTQKGIVEQATLTEIDTGTDSTRFVTPEGAKRAAEKHGLVKSINGQTGIVTLPDATTTKKGIVEQATLAEVESGTDATRFVTPEGAKRAVEKHALVKSVNGQTGDITIEAGNEGQDSGWINPPLLKRIVNYSSSWQSARYRK